MTEYIIRRGDGKYLIVATLSDQQRRLQNVPVWTADPDLAHHWPTMSEALMAALSLQLSGDYVVDPVQGAN